MKQLAIFWKFTRPHTVIGSIVSICTLYLIIYSKAEVWQPLYLIMALAIGISCNIFIVGINEIADVNIDKINKPYLPIPAGELSIYGAKVIVYTALCISLSLALFVSLWLFGIIVLSAAIGWAYSMPPLYLKQHHLPAALAVATVRGLLLNLGGFLVFNYIVNRSVELPENVKILTIFILLFSIVIAWFKDLPDIEGDAKYNIKTLAVMYSPKTSLIAGTLLIGAAYLFTISIKLIDFYSFENTSPKTKVLLYGHIVLLVLFLINVFSIKLNEHKSVKKFYKRFWWFFFAEYALYFVAYALQVSMNKI